jgi:pimeloyl-ACP methyl ester carboxylesterase
VAVLVAAGLLVGMAAGPRPRVDLAFRPAQFGADLEGELARAEAQRGVPVEAAARIAWHDAATRAATPLSVVMLHGFSATPQETLPLAEQVAGSLGANLHLARLAGHGLGGEALGAASASDWVADADRAMAVGTRIGERVVLMGVSTGATLGLLLATRPEWRGRIAALVLVSPNLGPRATGSELLAGPWAEQIAWVATGGEHAFEPANAEHARWWTTRYPSRVLPQMMALVTAVRALETRYLAHPALVYYAPGDTVVRSELTAAACARSPAWDCREVVDSGDPAQHVLAGRILSPSTTDRLAAEIAAYAAAASGR